MHKDSKQTQKRNTAKHAATFIREGNAQEIAKILRRRSINTMRFIKRFALALPRYFYNLGPIKTRRERRRLLHALQQTYGITDSPDAPVKIAIIVRDGKTYPKSSAFIRLIGPLSHPTVRDRVNLDIYPENTTGLDGEYVACIVQRTAYDTVAAAEALIKSLAEHATKLVVDSDDAFTVIDPTHPEHTEQSSRVEAFTSLLHAADEVWLSTNELASTYPALKQKPIVIQNYLDERVWHSDVAASRHASTNPVIQMVYMGTATHDADLELILPALKQLQKDYPGSFQLNVIGVSSSLPDEQWITRLVPDKSSLYPLFVEWFTKQGPFHIGLSPLVDSPFNRSKSDIKCLDYIAVGAQPVVSDLKPYDNRALSPYIVRVKDADWYTKLADILEQREDFIAASAERAAKAQQYVWSERSCAQAAAVLLKRIEKITASDVLHD